MESRLDKARREERELLKRCWDKIHKYDEEKKFRDYVMIGGDLNGSR